MSESQQTELSYAQLLETNNLLQACGDETYWLCVTRTVQESKLFPVSSYMLLSYLNAFYRYPALLRKIEASMPAERIADRARYVGLRISTIGMGWCMIGFYLLGREMLINMGMLRPQDAAEDVIYVLDFWKRFQLSWHRNNGHITNQEAGHRGQILPESTLQVFHSDLYPCAPGDALHTAAVKFTAAASQYGFLVACESRISLNNHGPYALGNGVEMIVRDFMELAEGDLPWLDGVAGEVPYSSLTMTTAVKDTHFYLMDDWGSFETKPEYKAENVCGVGLYTSDVLTEGRVPVGMGSAEELTATFDRLAETLRDATARLWKRFAGWSRDQMLDAGAFTYYAIIKDLAHIAGCYDPEDWMRIDVRAERFRPLLNDEYSNELLGALLVPLTLPSAQCQDYLMMQHANLPKRVYTPLPLTLLDGESFVPSVGPPQAGLTYLPQKEDRYRTSRGVIGIDDYNRLAAGFTPAICAPRFRNLDETWVKYNYTDPLADEYYKLHQAQARKIAGAGAGLRRADVAALSDLK